MIELWSALRLAKDAKLKAYEISLQNAFAYIVQNPLSHRTSCDMVVNAQWGEVGITSPGGDIVDVEQIEGETGKLDYTDSSITFRSPDLKQATGARVR